MGLKYIIVYFIRNMIFFCFLDFDVKLDLVWFYLSFVILFVISDDIFLLVVGFENGNIIFWDRYLGIIYIIYIF